MSVLHIDGIAKTFGDTTALHEISLRVTDGEFVTLLGPSGCGKTTLMRIIAGITQPDRGRSGLTAETFKPFRQSGAISGWCSNPMPSFRT